ncbi:LINE-1 reverse transcriptase [Glycine max]|nr:LINE-1 reverse transcriptase [Glycine max]
MGKLRETSSRLLNRHPKIAILLETRVKCDKAKKVKDYLNLRGKYLDNYQAHYNGRIWIFWDDSYKDIRLVKCTSQMIHCGVYDVNGNFQNWMTAIYAMNQLDQRRKLWEDLEHIHNSQQGPWFLMGDFNNLTKSMDRVGGNLVTEREYVDLRNLMDHAGLFEKDSTGEYFTWTNKHSIDVKLEILPPSIFDHCLLCLSDQKNNRTLHTKFKFTNSVVKSWNKAYVGRPMVRLWYKLMRLQAPLIKLSKQFSHLHMSFVQARTELLKAQEELTMDRMNRGNIEKVKKYIDELIYLQELNDNMQRQRMKLDWLREGDTNSDFFYAYLNSRNVATHISQLQKENGTYIQNPADIEKEVCEFYGKLYGTREQSVSMIDINAMREGPQLTMVQRADLITPVTVVEIKNAIKGIGDLKSPGIDGYGGKFFKASLDIIEKDVKSKLELSGHGREV